MRRRGRRSVCRYTSARNDEPLTGWQCAAALMTSHAGVSGATGGSAAFVHQSHQSCSWAFAVRRAFPWRCVRGTGGVYEACGWQGCEAWSSGVLQLESSVGAVRGRRGTKELVNVRCRTENK